MGSEHAWLVLNGLPEIGPITVKRLLDRFGNPNSILNASRNELLDVKGVGDKAATVVQNWERHFDLEKELRQMEQLSCSFIHQGSPEYPANIRNIYDPPLGFYVRGGYRFSEGQPVIAMVGSRRTTLYGQRTARQFAERLAAMGVCVVSGMARGIDSAAHEGALEAGGDTVAVMGCGVDIIYPPENLELYRRLIDQGAVISEFRLGRRADRQTFPMRNRIVSGLSDGVLVVETDLNGGSMITAKFAADQGRQVYAIPGRIDQAGSKGCHQLIREGAILTTSVDDILEDMKFRLNYGFESNGGDSKETPKTPLNLDSEEAEVYALFQNEPTLAADQVAAHLNLSISDVNARLMMLELKKIIRKRMDGNFELC